MNNLKHIINQSDVSTQLWEAFKIDAKQHRKDNHETTYTGPSSITVIRDGKRYCVTQLTKDNNNISVEEYEELYH